MTGPDRPDALQPAPGAPAATAEAPAPLPLPAPPRPASPLSSRTRKAWAVVFEVVLTALVLAFAFLVSSFVARNADLWLHLASGRLIAHGAPSFGTDPFAYTTAGVRWVNHAWLYDLASYLLHGTAGDAWLVVVKAALIAALAGVMLLIRQPGLPGWAPAFCAALAVLAMSPRLQLQPACVSLLLLGVTLWVLWRFRAPAHPSARRRRLFGREIDPRVWLLPLFALWVNLDDWFLLGPALVALFWAGDRLRRPARPTPGWLIPACLVACLCSPYHVFGFTLPGELYPLPFSGGLLHDPRFIRLSASPWQIDPGFHSPAGSNLAGLAYFALVLLGAASFAPDRSALRDWRVLVWGAFALLGAWQARLIPFFAVVGGPVAALNIQGMKAESPRGALLGLRAACLGLLAALIALAVPGWLHGFNQRMRQVAWGVEADPSLRRAAETLHAWRQDGRLGDEELSFALHPDAACYLAWFAPGERSFLDARLPLFSGVADEYVDVCRNLDPTLSAAKESGRAALNRTFTDRHVGVVLIYDPDPQRVLALLGRMYSDPDAWTLLSVDGQAMLFGWNPARADRFASLKFDPGRLAFSDDGAAPNRAPPAPQGPPPFGRPPTPPAWDSAAAAAYLRLFTDDLLPGRREAVDRYYFTAAAGYAGLTGLPTDGPTTLALRYAALDEGLKELSEKAPDLPLLAARAARRAVAADPDDANAYLRLGQAYLALRDETPERTRGGGLTPLGMVRHVQIAAALTQALALDPDLEPAHEHLANLFMERRYFDAALDHRREQLRLTRRAGRLLGEDAAAFQNRVAALEADVQALEKFVQDQRDLCEIRFRSLGDDPLRKAQTAMELGLAEKALDDVLMQSRVELFGSAGARRELELLLLLGRAREAKAMLDDEDMKANRQKLTTYELPYGTTSNPAAVYSFPAYEWLVACAAAAVGDYDQGDAALGEVGDHLQGQGRVDAEAYKDLSALAAASDVGVLAQAQGRLTPFPLMCIENREMQDHLAMLRAQGADVQTMRAALDLERGAPAAARRRLEEGGALTGPAKEAGTAAEGAALARYYLRRLTDAGP